MLWIALHLPLLSLESFAATLTGEQARSPLALVDAHHIATVERRRRGRSASSRARSAPPRWRSRPSCCSARPMRRVTRRRCTAVAHAALAFTPSVCVQPAHDPSRGADTVLLEVQASLRYFGGHARLLQRLRAALVPLGHRVHVASAPTPLGAALLARAPRRVHASEAADAAARARRRAGVAARPRARALGGAAGHGPAHAGRPAPAAARRPGAALRRRRCWPTSTVPTASGPTRACRSRCRRSFESRLELFARADSTEQVLHGAGVLLARLVAWLAGAARLRARLHAGACSTSRAGAAMRRAGADRCCRSRWPSPRATPRTCSCCCASGWRSCSCPRRRSSCAWRRDDIVRGAPPNGELFPSAAQRARRPGAAGRAAAGAARAPSRCSACRRVHDHRPERASAHRSRSTRPRAGASAAPCGGGAAPRALRAGVAARAAAAAARARCAAAARRRAAATAERPRAHRGRLVGRTRLAERDYFIAQAADGALVWIYRARLPGRAGRAGLVPARALRVKPG